MATIVCLEECKLLTLDRKGFNKVIRAKEVNYNYNLFFWDYSFQKCYNLKAKEVNIELDYLTERPFLKDVKNAFVREIFARINNRDI